MERLQNRAMAEAICGLSDATRLTQGTTKVLGQTFGLILRRGAEHRLPVNLHFVAEDRELHSDPAVMASVGLKRWHLTLFEAEAVLGCFENETRKVSCLFLPAGAIDPPTPASAPNSNPRSADLFILHPLSF